jgi:hypothetical protein
MASRSDRIYSLLEALKPGDAIPDEVVQEILSWDMTGIPDYTAEELMEPFATSAQASMPDARYGPGKKETGLPALIPPYTRGGGAGGGSAARAVTVHGPKTHVDH